MELEKYLSPLLKWWWLILGATIISATASFLATSQQTPVYKSRTTLMVGSSISNLNPSSGDVYLSQYLAGVYADFANREPVQQATKEALDIEWLPAYTARLIPNSQIIEITVTANNPDISQIVAEELAYQLILLSPSSGAENQKRQEFIKNQLNILEGQIVDTRASIEELQEELPTINSARQIAEVQSQIDTLSDKLDTLQANYANLLSSTPQGAANTLTILEPAQFGYPDQPNRLTPIFLASAIGFLLAAGAAYIIEYLDQALYTEEDIQRVFGVPVLGYIMQLTDETKRSDYIATYPRSPVAEAFRSLRTNLTFAIPNPSFQTLLISSVDMGEGKTTIIANLAISFAQAEKKVTVIDADMRRPSLHDQLGIPQSPGLAEALTSPERVIEYTFQINGNHVSALPAGEIPPNPAEILASKKMDQILDTFKKTNDYVIIDGPPFLVTDASILAARSDGVLLVVTPGKVRQDAARKIKLQLDQVGAHLLGIVFNRIPPKDMRKYGNYSNYYHPYYQKVEEFKKEVRFEDAVLSESPEVGPDSGSDLESQIFSATEEKPGTKLNSRAETESEPINSPPEAEPDIEPKIKTELVPEVVAPFEVPVLADDLKKIEGIGSKVASLLKENGIETFAQLAGTPVEKLNEILVGANLHMMHPDTWPRQAGLAALGEWEALQDLRKELKGGRKISG